MYVCSVDSFSLKHTSDLSETALFNEVVVWTAAVGSYCSHGLTDLY